MVREPLYEPDNYIVSFTTLKISYTPSVVFTTDRSKAVVLVFVVLCLNIWLFAAGLFSCFVKFVFLLCFVDSVLAL